MCRPDVFSIRKSSVQVYLEPIVHEIKVSRTDLLGDLKLPNKRNAYLDIAGQCWYVLGRDSKGRAIGEPEEVPLDCGDLVCTGHKLEVLRMHKSAPPRNCHLRYGWHWQRRHRLRYLKASRIQASWDCETFHLYVAN